MEIIEFRLVELLAEREGCFMDATGGWYIRDKRIPGVCYPLDEKPKYLSSLDALQPILATLTEEEWESLKDELETEYENTPILSYTAFLITIKPSQLARCIGRVIAWEKGE